MHIAVAGNIGAGKTTLTRFWRNITNGNPIMKTLLTIPIWMIFTIKWSVGRLIFRYTF